MIDHRAGSAIDGSRIARWLRDHIEPYPVYYEGTATQLEPLGVYYDMPSHMLWLPDGALQPLPTYSPAELVRHPMLTVSNLTDTGPHRMIIGFELVMAINSLLWQTEPGITGTDPVLMYEDGLRSISERGRLPYRSKH